MVNITKTLTEKMERLLNKTSLKLRSKLILIFLTVKVIPIVILLAIALSQISTLGHLLRTLAVEDSSQALNRSAIENIERMTTDTAQQVARFLYQRDQDIRLLANMNPSDEVYRAFSENRNSKLMRKGEWILAEDGMSWVAENPMIFDGPLGVSSNVENDDIVNGSSFSSRAPEVFEYDLVPLYDEIAFIDLEGNQVFRYVSPGSPKKNYPFSQEKRNISDRMNTYIKAEDYFQELKKLQPGDIYVSDVIGAYVGTNYIGMYTPGVLAENVPETHPNFALLSDISQLPQNEFIKIAEEQAYAGRENPNGQRFEGIVRWATPVTGEDGSITGYVTFALNHDHIMAFVDHITPMNERYTELPSAYGGNYAFVWDYKCRSICHPRHNSIVGYDPETGNPQVPWLESSLYDAWQKNAKEYPEWFRYFEAANVKPFDQQSRQKSPAPALTAAGLVGLDGRYLNNAPQCTGWMDLTANGGSGSFYILWSDLYKLTTAGAIPYYTGQYAPSPENNYSRRGFGFVTIGAGLDDFTQAARDTEIKLTGTIESNMRQNILHLVLITFALVVLVIFVAIMLAFYLTNSIQVIIDGISHFRVGERNFRIQSRARDELGELANSFDEMADSIENSVNEPLSIIDMDQKVIYMNGHALNLLGKTLTEVVGASYNEISMYPYGSKYCPVTALSEKREAEVYYQEECDNYFKGHANYLLDKNGEKIGYIIVSNNVTEIEIARRKSEQANVAKSNFLSNMSHEMRTPLNAIIGMTSIGSEALDIEKKDYALSKINDASTHLLGVINDVLDMSKIEANKFTLSATDFVFEKMFQRIVDVISFRIDEKHQKLTVHIDPNIPPVLVGDEQRLAQVITNLLTNAMKFTPDEGSIHIEAKLSAQSNKICTLLISISDTGIGITNEQQNRLFHAFEQAEASTSRKFGGTGLGLVISRSIVEMMDGTIWVDSKLGEGSTFSFTVCLASGESQGKRLLSPRLDANNTRILAVDDDPSVQQFFKEMAKRTGIKCDVASGGPQALDLIAQNGAYNIYFVDWLMPEMDGVELSRSIHQKDDENAVIIMISATDWSEIQEQASAAGVTSYLPKPLFVSSIANCINEFLETEKAGVGETNKAADNFEGKCILLAEDIEINREIVLTVLEPTGLMIDCAANGLEAVKMFTANPKRYEMIFMDVQMPEMDGFAATRMIRESDVTGARTIPIVAMTANVFKEDIEKCLDAGMNGHVGKPIKIDEVMEQLHKYLR